VLLLTEAGFLDAQSTPSSDGGSLVWPPLRLTFSGHEFLDTIRDPEVWRRTKAGALKVGGLSVALLKTIATGYLKHLIKEKLGLYLT